MFGRDIEQLNCGNIRHSQSLAGVPGRGHGPLSIRRKFRGDLVARMSPVRNVPIHAVRELLTRRRFVAVGAGAPKGDATHPDLSEKSFLGKKW